MTYINLSSLMAYFLHHCLCKSGQVFQCVFKCVCFFIYIYMHILANDFVNTVNEGCHSGTTMGWPFRIIGSLINVFVEDLQNTHKKRLCAILCCTKKFTEIQILLTLILSKIKDLLFQQGTCDSLFCPTHWHWFQVGKDIPLARYKELGAETHPSDCSS